MLSRISGVSRPVLTVLATLALSACSTTMTNHDAMSKKDGMQCACCTDMKDGCPCCAGMGEGKTMMCQPKQHAQ